MTASEPPCRTCLFPEVGFWYWDKCWRTCFNKNLSTHLLLHFLQASRNILKWLVARVWALYLCHVAFLILRVSNWRRWLSSWLNHMVYGGFLLLAKAGKTSYTFLCLSLLSHKYTYTINTHAPSESRPTEDQASGQSDACLPALRRDVVSPANRWRNRCDGSKN